jgi:hypothetical protein
MKKPVTYTDPLTGKVMRIISRRMLWKITFRTSVTRRNHIEDGIRAWERLKHSRSQNYNDWMQVAEALEIGQKECMRLAETDKPQGSRYRKIFGDWLREHHFDDMDKGDRVLALKILSDRPKIETWRAELELDERLNLNHPRAILRRYEAEALRK